MSDYSASSLDLDFFNSGGTATSVYIGNKASDVAAAEDWLGTSLDAIQLHQGVSSWSDWLHSVSWIDDQLSSVDTPKMWSIGLIPWGASLSEAASGSYNDNYLALAEQMLAEAPDDGAIYIRLGWEMNTDGWNPWSAAGDAESYVGAYQQFVDQFRDVSDRFVFEWTPNINTGVDPEAFYPGDDYVDVVGIDFYYNTQWDSTDATRAFSWFVTEQWGLQWQQDFAAEHGKATAIAEWGLNSDSAEFVRLVADWAETNDMLYQNYWDSDAAFQGKLSSGQYPSASAAFVEAFGTTVASEVVLDSGDVAMALTGSHDQNMIGNALDNVLVGNDGVNLIKGGWGNDIIDGGHGADIMQGGDGNDLF
ncbi:hypothetical protein KY084_03305 [Stakelama sp. CBK3Z-3]|uniref:GH26 domain-containing protein n=1 Tax=Stakelama flava TaxID=2860338 RepID=A0ABS6XID7_9SPHN|nr:glycosyl hydrolase [Stakelama flava]MBW4329901.1 hypothetical protein [Stakelama flava]